ncbi:hypothetical protein D3C81_661980 [compost metagenome]|uniref:Caspase-1, p20 n=1 Tax=Pseudomonas wadenswilerensis TaxID=1785161 RepID=A0A380T0R8_9PSED|nr:Caspase-1, p20 [Pseudomonas wadenswilerensis]
MKRLRKQEQPLNELQTKRFQQAVREVSEAVNATGEAKKVTVSYLFKSGSGTPQVTMIKGSGKLEIRAPIEFPLLDAQKLVGMCGSRPCS